MDLASDGMNMAVSALRPGRSFHLPEGRPRRRSRGFTLPRQLDRQRVPIGSRCCAYQSMRLMYD